MDIDCTAFSDKVRGFALVRNCEPIRNGMLRIETPFQYPDGSRIDLFVGRSSDLFQQIILTDLGQTTAYLLDLHLKSWISKKRIQLVQDICASLEVEQDGGQFKVKLAFEQQDFGDALVRLAQACIRVADLAFTQRLRLGAMFQEDFEEFIARTELPYDQEIELEGRYGRNVRVDFLIRGRKVQTLVLTLSTANSAASHGMATEAFRKWHDLEPHRSRHQFLSVFDSSTSAFRDDDIQRLKGVSTVLAFPAEQDEIQDAVAA